MNLTKNITNQPKSIVDVEVSVPWADLEPKWNETLQRLSADVELPGFRKGQAPAEMVEQNLAGKLQQEFLQTVMPQILMEALQGTDIVPIDYPQYQVNSFAKGGELKFTAKIAVRPKIEVGNYKSIKAAKPAGKTVSDEEVNKIVGELFNRWKSRNPSTSSGQGPQPAAPKAETPAGGTSGSLNFNGQPGGGAAAPAASPAPTSDQPDDNFAKAVGADSLADLKAKIRTDLEGEANYNNELDYEESILQEVEKITVVDVPEILVQDELNRMLVSLQRSVTERGLLLDEYLKSQNKTADQLKTEWRPQAERNVRMELGLSEIARQEGVNISDDELQSEIDKIQDQRVKAQFNSEEPRMHLRHALRQTKTLNLLKTLVG
jgi:trigger factor